MKSEWRSEWQEYLRKNPNEAALLGSIALFIVFIFIYLPLQLRAELVDRRQIDQLSIVIEEEPLWFDPSELAVIQALPQGAITIDNLRREIVVVFNRPMVPLSTALVRQAATPPFRIEPPIEGEFRWYGSRAAAFVPAEALPAGGSWQVVVESSLTDIDGKSLEEPYKFGFATPPLQLDSITPGISGQMIRSDQEFTIQFNYPVALTDARNHLQLRVNGNRWPISLRRPAVDEIDEWLLWSEDPLLSRSEQRRHVASRQLYLRPERVLPPAALVELTLSPGLNAEGTTNRSGQAFDLAWRTYGPVSLQLDEPEAESFQLLWRSSLTFSNPMSVRNVLAAVRFDPPAQLHRDPRQIDADQESHRFALYEWQLRPGQRYTIEVPAKLSDRFGNQMDKAYSLEFRAPLYRPEIDSERTHAILEAKLDPQLPLTLTGVSHAVVESAPFNLTDLFAMQNDSRRDIWSRLQVNSRNWLSGVGRDEKRDVALDLSAELNASGTFLALRLRPGAKMEDREAHIANNPLRQLFLQYTDLGLTAKMGSSSAMVWVHSLASGRPLAGAVVRHYHNGKAAAECRTGESGGCRLDLREMGDRNLFYAEHSGDRAFLSDHYHSLSMWGLSDHFRTPQMGPQLLGQIIFDRRLYRPGESLSFKGVLARRSEEGLAPLAGEPVEVIVRDSHGSEIFRESLRSSPAGGVWGELELNREAVTGHYSVTMIDKGSAERYERSWQIQVSETFQVEEFRPAAFSVAVDGSDHAFAGREQSFSVDARYLFGAPLFELPVRWSVQRQPLFVTFDGYDGYLFGDGIDPWRFDFQPIEEQSMLLNRSGSADYRLRLPRQPPTSLLDDVADSFSAGLSAPYRLEVEATVRDRDASSVSGRRRVAIYPAEDLPGMRPHSWYGHIDQPFSIDLVSLRHDGSRSTAQTLQIEVLRKEWKSSLSRGPGGSVQRRNHAELILLSRESVVVGADPLRYSFRTERAGEHIVTLRDPSSGAYSRLSIYAYGGEFTAWDYRDDDVVRLMSDKSSYRPGEKARIFVQSPYSESEAIVTVERDGVMEARSISIRDGQSDPIEIEIKDSYAPNVYIGVVLIRPRTATGSGSDAAAAQVGIDPGRPQLKAGILPIRVDRSAQELPLLVRSDRSDYRPRDQVKLTIIGSANAEVALTVADRAVLDLIQYRFDSPLETFYGHWPLHVQLLENRSAIVSQLSASAKGESPGGDGKDSSTTGLGGFRERDEDGVRRDFRMTAYWKPSIELDANGRAELSFRLPDNLTTFRVMAISADTAARYGHASSEFRVRQPLTLQRSLPRFLRVDDRPHLGVVLTNQSGQSGRFEVELQSQALRVEMPRRVVMLEEGHSAEVLFPAQPDEEYISRLRRAEEGVAIELSGTIRVQQLGGAHSDAIEFRLPLIETLPLNAFAISGTLDERRLAESIEWPATETIHPYSGRLDLRLASSILIGVDDAFRHSIERSRERQELTVEEYLTWSQLQLRKERKAPDLREWQQNDGGLRRFQSHRQSDPYLSAFGLFVIQQAEKAGLNVDATMRRRLLDYLRHYPSTRIASNRSHYRLETLAFIAYLMGREGEVQRQLIHFLYENRANLSLRARGNLALAIIESENYRHDNWQGDSRLRELRREIDNSIDFTTRRIFWRDRAYGSHLAASYSEGTLLATMIELFLRTEPLSPLLAGMVEHSISAQGARLWHDGHATALLSVALDHYAERFERAPGELSATLRLDQKPLSEVSFTESKQEQSESYRLEELSSHYRPGERSRLEITKNGTGRLYYSALLRYSPRFGADRPYSTGIELYRELLSIDGHPLADPTRLPRGETILVRLTLISPRPLFDLRLSDPIPAGSEIVQSRFESESSRLRRVLHDYRADPQRGDRPEQWFSSAPEWSFRDDRADLRQSYLAPGMHEFLYLLRPITPGRVSYPAAEARPLYEPELFGRSASSWVVIE